MTSRLKSSLLNEAHFKKLLHSINSCEPTRRQAGCCRNPTAYLPGSITTGCDTCTCVHLGNKSEASSSHLAQAHAGSRVSAGMGTSGTTASAPGTATSRCQPYPHSCSRYPLAGGTLTRDSIAQEWQPPRCSGHGAAGGPRERGNGTRQEQTLNLPGPASFAWDRPAASSAGTNRGQESCQRETTTLGQSHLAPGTACMYAHTQTHTHRVCQQTLHPQVGSYQILLSQLAGQRQGIFFYKLIQLAERNGL